MIDFMCWFTLIYSVQSSQSTLGIVCTHFHMRINVQGRFRWPRGLRRESAAACLLGLLVRIPPGAWMSLCCECRLLSDRGLRVGLSTCPEDPYRV